MSTVKALNFQIGQSVTATNNFTWYQPASPDGTVRLGNGNSGSVTDLITVGSTGNLTFTGTTETYTNSVTITAASTKTLTLNGGAGSNGLVIDASNNVGIGTSSPTAAGAGYVSLTLNGSTSSFMDLRSNNGSVGRIQADNANSFGVSNIAGASGYTHFDTNGYERMRIDASGALTVPNIYSNTTASVTYVAVSSAGLLQRGGVSALKYKQDIRDLESIDITKFRPVRYKSKCENDDQTIDYFGFIADEVEEAGIKELITYNDDGEPEGFQYERMTVVLLKAIQELSQEIETLKQRIK